LTSKGLLLERLDGGLLLDWLDGGLILGSLRLTSKGLLLDRLDGGLLLDWLENGLDFGQIDLPGRFAPVGVTAVLLLLQLGTEPVLAQGREVMVGEHALVCVPETGAYINKEKYKTGANITF
jgi:hypothetical protein